MNIMQNISEATSISHALREVAMVAEITTTALGLARTDRLASNKSDLDHNARTGISRVVVSRLAGAQDLHDKACGLQRRMRENLRTYSTTWGQGARRLLPNANFEAWIRVHYQLKTEFDGVVEEVYRKAPEIVEQARRNLGDYDIEPPSIEEIERAYDANYLLEPIPDASSFHGMPPQVEQHLRMQFERNVQLAYSEAQQDAVSRVAKPIGTLIEGLTRYEEREKALLEGHREIGKAGIFRDSLVTNVQEVADVFGSFNLTGIPELSAIEQRLELFRGVSPDDLRKSQELRTNVKTKAQELLEEVNDWLLPSQRK